MAVVVACASGTPRHLSFSNSGPNTSVHTRSVPAHPHAALCKQVARVETSKLQCTLTDVPGHRDLVKNAITGGPGVCLGWALGVCIVVWL